MVGRGNGNIAFVARAEVGVHVVLDEFVKRSLPFFVEITILICSLLIVPRLQLSPRSVAGKEERVVAGHAEVNHEIDVESGRYRHGRISPFRDEHTLRIVLILPGTHLVPQFRRLDLTGIILDERCRHIHTEAINALVEPECHDVSQFTTQSLRARRGDRLLPFVVRIRMGKAIVECRLALKEVLLVVFSARSIDFHITAKRRRLRIWLLVSCNDVGLVLIADGVGPDIVVGIASVAVTVCTLLEPLALHAGVPGHEIKTHFDAAFVGFVGSCRSR